MIEARAPGKLFIAGEYAVVEPGEPAVLVAVDRYLTVRLTESTDAGRVHSEEYGRAPLVWMRDADGTSIVVEPHSYDYVFAAISVAERLRAERGLSPRYFDLVIGSELDDGEGRKFGLGSSAAVTAAVISALDEFYRLSLSPVERFKLAMLATIDVAPKSSGGDLAASTFGGWIRYTSPDRDALRKHLSAHGVSRTLVSDAWAGSGATRIPSSTSLDLLVGWTGSPASTGHLVERVKRPHVDAHERYAAFVDASRTAVDELVHALQHDEARAFDVIRRARRLMQDLGEVSGITIETEKLAHLCDIAEQHGAAGKPSGAGGGDCGIVLADTSADAAGILRGWEAHGIHRLGLSVHSSEGEIDAF